MNNFALRGICFAQSLRAAAKDRRGVTAIEYALIGALMAAVVVTAVGSLTIHQFDMKGC